MSPSNPTGLAGSPHSPLAALPLCPRPLQSTEKARGSPEAFSMTFRGGPTFSPQNKPSLGLGATGLHFPAHSIRLTERSHQAEHEPVSQKHSPSSHNPVRACVWVAPPLGSRDALLSPLGCYLAGTHPPSVRPPLSGGCWPRRPRGSPGGCPRQREVGCLGRKTRGKMRLLLALGGLETP